MQSLYTNLDKDHLQPHKSGRQQPKKSLEIPYLFVLCIWIAYVHMQTHWETETDDQRVGKRPVRTIVFLNVHLISDRSDDNVPTNASWREENQPCDCLAKANT
jgi:hypothetical protein